MNCKICGTDNKKSFTGMILSKYEINYYHCSVCGFLQTEEPYWLEEAYSRPINISDTGYMMRNRFNSKRLTILLYLLFGKNGFYLDYAAGYGVLVRMMRDIGFDFYWEDKYTSNMFAVGFEWDRTNKVDAVTLFEAFEHFVEPISEIQRLLKISDVIIYTTDLLPNPIPKLNDWWYFGLDHGQHIAFYSTNTFKYIAEKFDLCYLNLGSLHILSKYDIPIWKLRVTRLTKFGLHKIIEGAMTSKTLTDYESMSKDVQ